MYERFRKRMEKRGSFMGETMRRQSDMVVNATWLNSVATRRVQVKNLKYGLPPDYQNVNDFEDPIDAHFNTKSAYSLSNGESPYYLTFRPGEQLRHPEIQVGSYVCIPNVDDIPEWWIIVFIEDDNELEKAQIMKCNWKLKWVVGGKIYEHLGVLLNNGNRFQEADDNSRTSIINDTGVMFTSTNFDTQTINVNQRFLISDTGRMPPICYVVSGVIDTRPVGLTKFTLSQSTYDPTHDNAELMLANYYDGNVVPEISEPEVKVFETATITYSGVNATVKVGGSWKTFTAAFSGEGVTVDKWLISDENGDISGDTENYTIEVSDMQMKLKVAQNYNLIGRVLIVQAIGTDKSMAEVQVEVIG